MLNQDYIGKWKYVEEFYENIHIYKDETNGIYYAARINDEGRAIFTAVKKIGSSWVPVE